MQRLLKWLSYIALALGIPAAAAAAVVCFASERALGERYPLRPERLVRPSPAAVADAARQARLLGCLSCHGDGLRGNEMFEGEGLGRIWAPNLPRLTRERTDAQLAAAIRQGVAPDGRPLLVMPSGLFSRLSDEEVSAQIAWIRSLPADAPETPRTRLSLLGRYTVLNGDMPIQPRLVGHYRRLMPPDLGPRHALGRRIAATVCAECHGADLAGGDRPHADFNSTIVQATPPTPDLSIAAAYDLPAFARLLRTGVPPGGRRLGMMAAVARSDFRHFTDEEIAALHAYLQARAAAQP